MGETAVRDPGPRGADPLDACGIALNDTAGTAGADGVAGITSADTFTAWYRDTMGVNMSGTHAITLTDDGTGVFEYLTTGFHPIDDRLLGNESAAHNYFFTYAFSAGFVHNACTDQFFEFEGTDDVWVFIDDQLVLDIGGVLPGTGQYIDFDRLDLVDGETYALRFFYAQRQDTFADFNVRTNDAGAATTRGFEVTWPWAPTRRLPGARLRESMYEPPMGQPPQAGERRPARCGALSLREHRPCGTSLPDHDH